MTQEREGEKTNPERFAAVSSGTSPEYRIYALRMKARFLLGHLLGENSHPVTTYHTTSLEA
ncbi:MAG: hypothetical protein SOV28_05120, partial [Bacteroidaceae bacterium]|nr:hypothetical protein [Bacteroidaceae bacterium]